MRASGERMPPATQEPAASGSHHRAGAASVAHRPGKRLMPRKQLQEALAARRTRKRRAAAVAEKTQQADAATQPRRLVCSSGNSANSRCRYTLVCRQLIKHYFGEGIPVGEVDRSILIVPGAHCRLEQISETGEWTVDQKFQVGDKVTVRKKGEAAGCVMIGWRKLRAAEPALFEDI